jgi:hypothetical protein
MQRLDRVRVSPAHREHSGKRGTVIERISATQVIVALDHERNEVFHVTELVKPSEYAALETALGEWSR